jgi:peptidoglycan/LPS O-acetylase OafA/YrhL
MNDRSTALLLIAVALAGYGVYTAAYVPAMLLGRPMPLLLIGFVLQAVCALAAAVGVWRRQPWAAGMVVLLGVSIAATWLVEAFVLGIVAYLDAMLVAVLAIVVALIIAAYVNRQQETKERVS